MNQLLNDVEGLVSPILEKGQIELVDVTFQNSPGGWVLCFYIDKPGGVNLDDCEKWSKEIGSLLDQSELIAHSYSLEVASPGITRPIRKLKDFQRFTGERVKVKLYASQDGQKNFTGILINADENRVRIRTHDTKVEIDLPRNQIAKAHLDPILDV